MRAPARSLVAVLANDELGFGAHLATFDTFLRTRGFFVRGLLPVPIGLFD